MYTQILNHIKRYVQLTADEEQLLCDNLQVVHLKKKQYLLEPGKHCQGNYFVLKGCLTAEFVRGRGYTAPSWPAEEPGGLRQTHSYMTMPQLPSVWQD